MASNSFFVNDSILFHAAASQCTDEISSVTQTLLCTPNVFSQQALDRSLLHTSENGPSILVHALLTAGAHLESRDERGKTPLLLSVGSNQINITRHLLDKGADVNTCDNMGDTSLILSTYFSASHSTTKLLLETRNIFIEHRNLNGFTALACAIQVMNLEAIKLLVDANAHVEFPSCAMANDLTFAYNMPTTVTEISRRNGIFNVIKFFKFQKDTGKAAVIQAAAKRDSRSIHYITTMDNTVLNYDSCIYIRALIEILSSIHSWTVSDNEMNIVRILTQMCLTLRKEPVDKLLEETAIELAVKSGNSSIIQFLCKSGFVISNAVLGLVAAKGNCYLLEMLVKHGANVCAVSNNGEKLYLGSALEKAIQNEQFECASLLISRGAFLDLSLALKSAVKSKQEKCLQFLFREFPESTSSIVKSSNLLHLAVGESAINISNMLLDVGADINGLHENTIPLMEATDFKCIGFLICRGADVNMVIGSNYSFRLVLHYFLSSKYKNYLKNNVSMKDRDDMWINWHHAALIKQLIDHGASVDGLDSMDRTPLMAASETEDSCEAIKELSKAGADINKTGRGGDTALHVAVRKRRAENAKCLLGLGADINAGSDTGNSVLFTCEDVDLLKLLLASKVDVNSVDSEGNNAIMFHLKEWSGNTTLISALIEAKCDVNYQNKAGETPLLLAAKILEPDLLLQLLRSGAYVNYSITEDGKTKSATSIIMKRFLNHRSSATECLQVLLNHGLHIKNIPPCFIHALISVGCSSILTKFIALGLPPTEMVIQRTVTAWYKSKCTISPLITALLMGNMQAAQLFVEIRFLTQKDLQLFSGSQDAKKYFQSQGNQRCLEFLAKISSQPLSLETLSFVAASEIFGSGPDRKDKIEKSGLPIPLQEAMLREKISFDLDDNYRRNLFLYTSALRNANLCTHAERYYEMMDEYDDDYDSDSD